MTAPQAAALGRAEALGGSGKVFLGLWYFPYFCVLKRKSLRLTGTFHFPICLPVLAWGTQGGQVEEVAPVCRDDPPACPGLITQLSAMTAVLWALELLGVSQQPLKAPTRGRGHCGVNCSPKACIIPNRQIGNLGG